MSRRRCVGRIYFINFNKLKTSRKRTIEFLLLITASGRQKDKVFSSTIKYGKRKSLDKRLQKRLDEFPYMLVKHENIYIEIPERPVCAILTQHQSGLDRKQREYQSCHKVKIEGVLGYKSLDATKIKFPFDRSRHCRRKLMETYSFVPHT